MPDRDWTPGDRAVLSPQFHPARWRGRTVRVERWAASSRAALLCVAADDPADKVFAEPRDLSPAGAGIGAGEANDPGRSPSPR